MYGIFLIREKPALRAVLITILYHSMVIQLIICPTASQQILSKSTLPMMHAISGLSLEAQLYDYNNSGKVRRNVIYEQVKMVLNVNQQGRGS